MWSSSCKPIVCVDRLTGSAAFPFDRLLTCCLYGCWRRELERTRLLLNSRCKGMSLQLRTCVQTSYGLYSFISSSTAFCQLRVCRQRPFHWAPGRRRCVSTLSRRWAPRSSGPNYDSSVRQRAVEEARAYTAGYGGRGEKPGMIFFLVGWKTKGMRGWWMDRMDGLIEKLIAEWMKIQRNERVIDG